MSQRNVEPNPLNRESKVDQYLGAIWKDGRAAGRQYSPLAVAWPPHGTHWYGFIAALLATGCCLSEFRVVRQSAIDLKKGIVNVRRSLRRQPDGTVVEADPKTASSRVVRVRGERGVTDRASVWPSA